MKDTGWFALLLFVALALSWLLSFFQNRAYQRASDRIGKLYAGRRDAILVSGRGKGIFRGAVVLLIIDSSNNRIIAAEAMVGMSVLARFKEHSELCGPKSSVMDRVRDPHIAKAVDYALQQYKVVKARGSARLSSQ